MRTITDEKLNDFLAKNKIANKKHTDFLNEYLLTESQLDTYLSFLINTNIKYDENVLSTILFCQKNLTETLIRKYLDFLSKYDGFFDIISYSSNLSESFMDEFSKKLTWRHLSYHQKMSESFIEKHIDLISMSYLLESKKLSKKFINKHLKSFTNLQWSILSRTQSLSESFIEKYKDNVDWNKISVFQKLSESFMRKYADRLNWNSISCNQKFSSKFLYEFVDELDLFNIDSKLFTKRVVIKCLEKKKTAYEVAFKVQLPHNLMEKYHYNLDWETLPSAQCLTQSFIKKHLNEFNVVTLARYQNLSDEVIDMIANKTNDESFWSTICAYQKLSENTMRKYFHNLYPNVLCKYQTLSENFIKDYLPCLDTFLLKTYQKYSDKFADAFGIDHSLRNIDNSKDVKKKLIKSKLYECHEDYFIAYKGIKKSRYSLFSFRYKYLPNKSYESNCDPTNNDCSFGLSVGTKDYVKKYISTNKNAIIVKCKVNYCDVGSIVYDAENVRCTKIEILE